MLLITFVILLLILGISVAIVIEDDGADISIILIGILSIVAITLIVLQLSEPKPIDVYRGKTTLEITYKDSIPVDSTVVWKNKL